MLSQIEFATVESLDPDELMTFYKRQQHEVSSGPDRLAGMMEQTSCFVTARRDGELIGLARGVTDGLSGRLAECKLDPAFQGPGCVTHTDGRIEHDETGIAGEMARRVIVSLFGQGVERIDVTAYGTEVDFCEELGFKKLRGVVAMELHTESFDPNRSLVNDAAQTV